MKFDAAHLQAIANATGFSPDNLEKILRLRELLTEFHKPPFLRDRIVLKGGTAINLFYLDLVRLSVDIDLNYIAQVEREKMLAERPDVVRAVDQIATGLGYRIQNGVDDHALREWHLGYSNHSGGQDRIQVEINFLMRTFALHPQALPAATVGDPQPCEFLVLATEELFAGKLKAMIDRRHPRDLYDLFRFTKSNLPHDSEILRKLAVLFSGTMDRDFRTYKIDRVSEIDAKQVESLLYPLFKATDRPTLAEMLAATKPLLESVLDHGREAAYLAAVSRAASAMGRRSAEALKRESRRGGGVNLFAGCVLGASSAAGREKRPKGENDVDLQAG
jgi:predicted nucleotidyltransferase component of viral defense system